METWTIDIIENKFHFKLWIDGKISEQYGPVVKDVAVIYAAAIINGFDPPRVLHSPNMVKAETKAIREMLGIDDKEINVKIASMDPPSKAYYDTIINHGKINSSENPLKNKFKPGDVVYLNSSPEVPMTIAIDMFVFGAELGLKKMKNKYYRCQWFDVKNHLQNENIDEECLTLYVNNQTPILPTRMPKAY